MAHLVCSLVGESHCADICGRDCMVLDQVSHSASEDACLARTGACQNLKWYVWVVGHGWNAQKQSETACQILVHQHLTFTLRCIEALEVACRWESHGGGKVNNARVALHVTGTGTSVYYAPSMHPPLL